MPPIGYAGGIALVLFFMVTLAAAAVRLRALVLPEWQGSQARLAELVLWLSTVTVISGLLGAVHGFYRAPELILATVACLVVLLAARGRVRISTAAPRVQAAGRPSAARPPDAITAIVVGGTIATVFADWMVRAREALMHGMSNVDTLWYHMPFAARFVQNGSFDAISFTQPDPVTPFFPANNELLHAVGILLLGHDTLSPLLNLGWLALALLAGWLIGRPFRASAATLVAVAIIAGTFIMTWSQAGEATNDMAALALFLASIAFVTNARSDDRALLMAAMPAGLALGMKVSLIAPVAVLFLGVVATAGAGRRRRVALFWVAAMLLLGCYWYARNLVAAGSPLPWIKIGLGGISLPRVYAAPALQSPGTGFGSTLAHLVTEHGSGAVLRSGLRYALGPAWWAILAIGATGLVVSSISRRDRVLQMLGLTGMIAWVAYVFSPQSGTEFVFNLRYLTPALTLGLVLVPLLAAARAPLARIAVLAALVALFVATQLDDTLIPPGQFLPWMVAAAVGAVAFALVGGLRRSPRILTGLVIGSVAAFAIAGFYVQRDYLHKRYAYSEAAAAAGLGQQESLWRVFAWARGIHHATIGMVGTQLQYPFFGLDLSNRVSYLERSWDHGRVVYRISSCASWTQAIRRVKPGYVVTTPVRFPFNSTVGEPREAAWTLSLPGVTQIVESAGQVFVFRINRLPRAGDCGRGD